MKIQPPVYQEVLLFALMGVLIFYPATFSGKITLDTDKVLEKAY
jgi:hypothetical protein